MRKSTLSLAAMALGACITLKPNTLFAQRDSAWLDAGTLKLPASLTQHISIKGEDLEKMPFTDLAEAINVWLYGAYTTSSNLRYVVDGIPLGDVNGYSVYDIEEVTLVQDALAQSNGVYRNQQLVLIRTKRCGGTGLTLAVEGGLVNRSTTNGYQHEYAGFHHEVGNIRFGVSGDYFQDVFPPVRADSIHTRIPFSLKRLQFSGWLVAAPGRHNQISVQVNYAPQRLDSSQHQAQPGFGNLYLDDQSTHQHEHVITPTVSWTSQFGKGWNSELRVGYLSWKGNQNGLRQSIDTASGPFSYTETTNGRYNVEHVQVNERLTYAFRAGTWSVIPSVNFYYEHDRLSSVDSSFVDGSGFISTGYLTFTGHGHLEELTPALNIAYRQALNIQGGLVAGLTHNYPNTSPTGKPVNRSFPFVSVGTDLLAWGHRTVRPGIKLFFSYAGSPQLLTTDYGLSTLTHPGSLDNLQVPIYNLITSGGLTMSPTTFFVVADPSLKRYWQWDAGISLSTADGRWMLDYHYEKQEFYSEVLTPVGYLGGWYASVPPFMSNLHVVAIRARVIQGRRFNWQTGLSATTLRVTAATFSQSIIGEAVVGDLNSNKPSWTGGWVNRFSFGALSVGADLLFHFNKLHNPPQGVYPIPPPTRINSFLMQRFYAGYRLALAKQHVLDLYLDSRGLFRSGQPDVADGRQYIGAGAKLNI